MTRKFNAFYGNCIHLKWLYPKHAGIGNQCARVIAYCKKFKVDAYKIKLGDDIQICCISRSYYTKRNCKHFKDRSNQTQLSAFLGDE